MLRVEDLVDGGERDVLVRPAVTSDEVQVEQLVVVALRDPPAEVQTGVSRLPPAVLFSSGPPTVPAAFSAVGPALCAMSLRNAVSMRTVLLGLSALVVGTGAARLPSMAPSSAVPGLRSGPTVTYCGSPRSGPGMNLP